MEPRIQYAQTKDGVSIAYWTLGEGPPLVITPVLGFGHLALEWQIPDLVAWYQRLASDRMIVRFDSRGMGMSQRNVHDHSVKALARDIEAVVDRLGLDRADVLANSVYCPLAAVFAADNVERVRKLVLWSPVHGPDYAEDEQVQAVSLLAETDWNLFTETWAHAALGWSRGEEAHGWASFIRQSMDRQDWLRKFEAFCRTDIRPYLSRIRAPTLIPMWARPEVQRHDAPRMIAATVRDAQLVHLEHGLRAPHQSERGTQAVEEFLGTEKATTTPVTLPEGTATILFADIVDSTSLTEQLGDSAFRAKARELDGLLRAIIRETGGTPVEGKVLGDGVLAVFTSARQAIECALRCNAAGDSVELQLHLGIHAGDVIREGNNVYGGAVNIAARIASASAPGEVLVSDTVRGLARTSAGVAFEDKGERSLKGVADTQRLFAVREGE